MFAEENYKFTKFLINNQEAFKHYFIQSNCNGEEVDKLFTIREVYSQITRIVESVSCIDILSFVIMHYVFNGMQCVPRSAKFL